MFLVTTTFIIWYWVIVGIVTLVALLIHAGIDNMGAFDTLDFFDTFFASFGWLTMLIVLSIGGIVYGFITWIWWAMLIIVAGLFGIAGIIAFIVHQYNDYQVKEYLKWKEENPEEAAKFEAQYNYINDEDEEENDSEDFSIESLVVHPNKNGITFKDIAGLADAKEAFKEKVILPFEHPELFTKFGKKAGGGILLYGLPGTGKTMFAEAAANELDALFISIKCSDIKSKWYGESEKNVKEIFEKARKAKKAIIFFDEFEAIGAKRTDNSDNGNNDLVPEILAEMQGVGTNNSDSTIMVIAATNKPWAIDSAFLRPGRFDEKIYIPLPDYESRKKQFELQLAKLPVADDLDYDFLAKITEGFNGADIKEVCEKLKMSAIKDSLAKGIEQTIGMDDVARIEETIKSSVSKEDIEKLQSFENNK